MGALTAIVIDDERSLRTLFAKVLRGAGMQVFEAESATAALAMAQTTRPDFVVTDIGMPMSTASSFVAGSARNLNSRICGLWS